MSDVKPIPIYLPLYKSLSVARTPRKDTRMAPVANLVLAALRTFAISGETVVFPSERKLSEMLGISIDSVQRGLRLLVETRQIDVITVTDQFPTVLDDGTPVYLKHNHYVLFCNPITYQRFGLFPLALFGLDLFTKEIDNTAKSVLLAIYLLAEGQSSPFILLKQLMDESMIRSREKVLRACRELERVGLVERFINPCTREQPYERCHLRFYLPTSATKPYRSATKPETSTTKPETSRDNEICDFLAS